MMSGLAFWIHPPGSVQLFSVTMSSYTTITSLAELEAAIESSHQGPVLVFKHSLTCGVSDSALRAARDHLANPRHRVIEIQKNRELSTELARSTGIRHESPQAIVFVDGKPSWTASHWSITSKALQAALATDP